MPSYRSLTSSEVTALGAGLRSRWQVGAAELKLLFVFVTGGALLSTPFAILFFCAARYLHGEQIDQSIQIGLLGFLPGVIIGLFIAVLGIIGANKPDLPGLRQDLAQGKCIVETYRAKRAWNLIDDGNLSDPDLLLDLDHDSVLAIPAHAMPIRGSARQNCSVSLLPSSKAVVSVEFSGDPIPILESAVETNNFWRNDDLPWCEPIRLDSVPGDLRAAIDLATRDKRKRID